MAPGVARVDVMSTDWRSDLVAALRELILSADPAMTVEAKWKKASNPAGVPTFSADGLVCTVETYKDKVKVTFAKGASPPMRRGCSTPAWMPAPGGRSTSARARRWILTPSSTWSARQSRSTALEQVDSDLPIASGAMRRRRRKLSPPHSGLTARSGADPR